MRLLFEVSPPTKLTRLFGSEKKSASVSTSSLFALPSTGAERIRTLSASPTTPSTPLRDERGCARTFSTTPSAVSL